MFKDYAAFQATLRSIESDPNAVVRTEYLNWPDELKIAHANPPLLSYKFSKIEFESILSSVKWYRDYRGWLNQKTFEVPDEVIQETNSKQDLFPKLGPVSWKESVGFTTVPGGDAANLMTTGLFNNINNRMAAVLHAYVVAKEEPHFYWFPYVDYSNTMEIRVIVKQKKFALGELSKQKLQESNVGSAVIKNQVKDYVEQTHLDNIQFDLSYDPFTEKLNLIEINPLNKYQP